MRWFLFLCTLASSRCFRICSFNIQCFGESKGAKPVVMEIITKIVARCDICLLMEVRDSSGAVVDQLLQDLNSYDQHHQYVYLASKRLGERKYKEQYVFIYRSDMVKITSSYQYKGGKKGLQTFAREPLIVRFSSPRTAIKDFVLIPLHAPPGEAVNEIDQLYNVFLDVRAKWDIEDIMILGDLNADCRYVSAKDWETIRLRNKPGFFWLIGDNQDTTASARTDCAYDRIIVHGWNFFKALVPGSAKVFNVQEEFKLTEKEAVEVSDHYPVEVKLKLEAVHYEL
ncbi:deoxyribonuclease-1-like isoform X1 [Scyliorhinus canicula]|uniref:deoxyribonuclease-1-like isoform X1 n=1 Tax=Scyliorhinus canicula TaxID=7830 RepID=UPI0018F47953|nr:deoxyribonuclease-1-like isoform X1 [Scyliorhinus canicula]